jgi:hypothetical protein
MTMRTTLVGFTLGALMAFGVGLSAETKTITGSLIDTKCHTKMGEKAMAAGHADCATTCFKNGAPVAVVTDGGIYHVTGAWTANNNEKLVEFAGKKVQATGAVTEQDGKMTIELTAVKAAAN